MVFSLEKPSTLLCTLSLCYLGTETGYSVVFSLEKPACHNTALLKTAAVALLPEADMASACCLMLLTLLGCTVTLVLRHLPLKVLAC